MEELVDKSLCVKLHQESSSTMKGKSHSPKVSPKKSVSVTQGKLEFVHGTYEGDLMNGKKHGVGKFVWSQGGTYEGEFHNGRMHGAGKMSYCCGEWAGYYYEGGWENDKRSGAGVLQEENGENRYEGMLAGTDGVGGGEAGDIGGLELEQAAKSRHNACVGQPVGEGGKEPGDGVGQVQPTLIHQGDQQAGQCLSSGRVC